MSKLTTITIFILMLLSNSLSWAGEDKRQNNFFQKFQSIFESETQKKKEIVNQQPKLLTNGSPEDSQAKSHDNPNIDVKINSNDKETSIEIAPKPIQSPEKPPTAQIIEIDSDQVKTLKQNSKSTDVQQKIRNQIPEQDASKEQQPVKIEAAKKTYSDNKQKGLAIIMEVDRRDTGWQDSQANLKMILKNRHGDQHSRTLKMKTMEVKDDGDKSLSIFSSPKDIKGTAFLSFTHALEPDEQWLYLPAVKRVKRISSRNKSGPYLGSEFAFEDLSSFEVKKYSYQYLRDEVFDNIDCFVIEAYPEYKHSGYKRTMLWIDKQRYILLRIDYYDRKNSLLKTQTFHGYQQYLNQFWRPDEMQMVNHTNGKSTSLIWGNYQFRKGLTARNFDKNTLKRAR